MEKDSQKPKNPHVFPVELENKEGGSLIKENGMTLRDYFANSAMQGLISNQAIVDDVSNSVPEWIATRSYLIADEMLKQRELQKQ